MLQHVLLTVTLKVPDNEARSALEAVRVKMGLADDVLDLRREDVWELALEAETQVAAADEVERMVASTNIFANPNKHHHTVVAADDSGAGGELEPNEMALLVADRGRGVEGSVVRAVQRAGGPVLSSARRWIRWTVKLAGPARAEDPETLALAEKIGVARSRESGLLSNPHSQICRLVLPGGAERALS